MNIMSSRVARYDAQNKQYDQSDSNSPLTHGDEPPPGWRPYSGGEKKVETANDFATLLSGNVNPLFNNR